MQLSQLRAIKLLTEQEEKCRRAYDHFRNKATLPELGADMTMMVELISRKEDILESLQGGHLVLHPGLGTLRSCLKEIGLRGDAKALHDLFELAWDEVENIWKAGTRTRLTSSQRKAHELEHGPLESLDVCPDEQMRRIAEIACHWKNVADKCSEVRQFIQTAVDASTPGKSKPGRKFKANKVGGKRKYPIELQKRAVQMWASGRYKKFVDLEAELKSGESSEYLAKMIEAHNKAKSRRNRKS